jgi:hypothetical protein
MASTHHRLKAAIGGALLVAAFATVGAGTASAQTPDTTMTVSPTTVARGGVFTVSGHDCTGDEVILAVDGEPAVTDDVNQAGDWSVELPVDPNAELGTYEISASCEDYYDSFAYDAVDITVVAQPPVIAVTAPGTTGTPSARVGGTLALVATGFQPGESVVATLHSTPVVVGTFVADATGKVTATIKIPTGTTLGSHQVLFVGAISQRSGAISINVVAAATGQLPVSGSNAGRDAAAAVAVLLIGLVVVGQSFQLPLRRTV